MSSSRSGNTRRLAATALLGLAAVARSACWESQSRNTVVLGERFRFGPGADAGDGGPRLLDSTTGDVWRLEGTGADRFSWTLRTRGPGDARVLDPGVALGFAPAE